MSIMLNVLNTRQATVSRKLRHCSTTLCFRIQLLLESLIHQGLTSWRCKTSEKPGTRFAQMEVERLGDNKKVEASRERTRKMALKKIAGEAG